MRRIAHIVNPVVVGENSDLYDAQPITFESMRIAKEFVRGKVDVELFTAQYPEDRSIVPDDFHVTPDLDRSILDFGTFQQPRKLPLIKDILDRLYDALDAEYLIYTNVDIAVLPHFYDSVSAIIDSGFDAFVINRRTIPDHFRNLAELPLMFACVGEKHIGHDCFVFKRDVSDNFELGKTCIGMPLIGQVLIWNLICQANNFKEFTDEHLTFHIGNDETWKDEGFSDYRRHNIEEAKQILGDLERKYGPIDDSVKMPFLFFTGQLNQRTSLFSGRRLRRFARRIYGHFENSR